MTLPFGIPAEGFPQRIVSTAPSLTETLFSLGVGDRVVGVTTWCRYPEEARSRPKIGGYSTPSMEAILALRPDLVVLAAEARSDVGRRLAELHVPTMAARLDSLRSIEDSIRQIALRLGVPERGEALATRIEAQRTAVARAVAGRPRVRTLLLLGHS
ncbi:MAG TPA: helical backbone metal receptor, partial [Vicinamibacteria bacterium]